MSAHISSVCKSVRYYLRNLGIIRKYLTRSATEKIVHAFISSRLDFGNAHFFQLPQSQLTRLQRLQNAAARLIMLSKLKDHITPILYSLHWLPVEFRIIFKLVLLVFHCLHGSAPEYNISIIKEYDPSQMPSILKYRFTCHSKSSYGLGGSILRTCWTISLE